MDGWNEHRVAIKICFKAGLSATEKLQRLVGMRLWSNQTFLVVFSISRRKGAGRRWRGSWPSKIDSNWGKHCCCCWFGQKWLSNRTKNDSRIFEHPKDSSPSDSERGFGKEKVVCTFCSTLLDTWAKGRSSHILPRHYRDSRCGQIFLNKIMRPGVLPMTPKQSDEVLNGLDRYHLSRRKWNSKCPASRPCW